MTTITTRAGKGSPLTNTEVDDNFSNLNSAKYESGAAPTFGSTILTTADTVNLTLDGASANSKNIYFKGDSSAQRGRIASIGTSLYFQLTDATNYFTINPGSTVINDSSVDHDFRVESNDNDHMLFVDGGANKVAVGTASPQQLLHLNSSGITYMRATGGTGTTGIDFGQHSNASGYIWHRDDAAVIIGTNSTERVRFGASTAGETTFNEGGDNFDFRVEGDSQDHALFVDASTSRVGIHQSSPSYPLDVNGAIHSATNVIIGDSSSSPGTLTLNDNSTTAYTLGFTGTGTRAFEMQGSASSGAYGLTMTNLGTGEFNLSVDGVLAVGESASPFSNDALRIRGQQDGTAIRFEAGGSHRFDLDCNGTGTDNLSFNNTDGAKLFTIYRGQEIVVNEDSSSTVDFRVETDNNSQTLFVDGGTDRVMIRNSASTTAPRVFLDIQGSGMPETSAPASVEDMLTLYQNGSASVWAGGATFAVGRYATGGSSAPLSRLDIKLKAAAGSNTALPEKSVMSVQSQGAVGINTVTPAAFLEVLDPTSGAFNGSLHVGGVGSNRRLVLEQTDVLTYKMGGTGTNSITQLVAGGSAGIGSVYTTLDQDGLLSHNKGAVFNETGGNNDFRVESDGSSNAIFVDAGNNRVGILTNAPPLPLSQGERTGSALNYINGTANTVSTDSGIFVSKTTTNEATVGFGLQLANNSNVADTRSPLIGFSALSASNSYNHTYAAIWGLKSGNGADTNWNTGQLHFGTSDGTGVDTRMKLSQVGGLITIPAANGHAVFNEDSADADFRVESDGNANMLFVDSGNNSVGIGTNATGSTALVVQAASGAGAISIIGRANGGIGTISFYDDNGTSNVGYLQGRADDNQFRLWTTTADTLSLGQNDVERLKVTDLGNTMIVNGFLGNNYTTGANGAMWSVSNFNDNDANTGGYVVITTSANEWQPNLLKVTGASVSSGAATPTAAVWYVRVYTYNGTVGGVSVLDSWTSGSISVSVTGTYISATSVRVNVIITTSANRSVGNVEVLSYAGVTDAARTQ